MERDVLEVHHDRTVLGDAAVRVPDPPHVRGVNDLPMRPGAARVQADRDGQVVPRLLLDPGVAVILDVAHDKRFLLFPSGDASVAAGVGEVSNAEAPERRAVDVVVPCLSPWSARMSLRL